MAAMIKFGRIGAEKEGQGGIVGAAGLPGCPHCRDGARRDGGMTNIYETRDRVRRLLVEFVGHVSVDEDGDFAFRHNSVEVQVYVHPFSDEPDNESLVITVHSVTNWAVPGSTELYRLIATLGGGGYWFANFSLYARDDGTFNVNCRHQLLADTFDPDELTQAVSGVACAADRFAKEIQGEFGGKILDDLTA